MYNNPRPSCSKETITIDTAIPFHQHKPPHVPAGYGIPKDTVNPEIKARLDYAPPRVNSLNFPPRNSLLPSPTNSFNSWAGKPTSFNELQFTPRIVIRSYSPPVDSETILPLPPRRTHRKSLCTAIALAAVITSIVTILIALLIFSE